MQNPRIKSLDVELSKPEADMVQRVYEYACHRKGIDAGKTAEANSEIVDKIGELVQCGIWDEQQLRVLVL